MFKKKRVEKKSNPTDSLKDIQAISEFLDDVKADHVFLKEKLKKLEELEKEANVTNNDILKVNLKAQSEIIDKLIERYEFFQNDVDINGIRVKMIAKEFLQRAKRAELKDIVKEKKKSQLWKFQW
jgi:hypothetical protein